MFVSSVVAHDYRVIKTPQAYTFEVVRGYARAYYDEIDNKLTIKAHGFLRTWNLPDDALGENARIFRETFGITVVVPRAHIPNLDGGEVLRGTVIRFKAANACLTTDGTDPVCGASSSCANGRKINEFTVENDETFVKIRSCDVPNVFAQTHYSAYDKDIVVEDVLEIDQVEDISGMGQGWFDRHGRERDY